MTTTIAAPVRMGRRQQVLDLLAGVPADLTGQRLRVMTPEGSLASTSFVDELVIEVLRRRNAERLTFVGGNAHLRSIAVRSAADLNVDDRLDFID